MNGRRRKDEPFNPFAPNASQKARDRKERSQKVQAKPRVPEPKKEVNDLAAKQKAAMEALRRQRQVEDKEVVEKRESTVANPRHTPSPQPKPAPKTSIKKPASREDRLATLRAKSAATAQFAKEAKDAKVTDPVEPELKAEVSVKQEIVEEISDLEHPSVNIEVEMTKRQKAVVSSNVFKTIKTEVKKTDRKQKKRRSQDRRGGGRQNQVKKLDRRKYLEYKYAARELLEDDAVKEEHRSNILGQIWAKGERSGVTDALDFINQKEAELIITEEIANEFRNMVKRYTTKR